MPLREISTNQVTEVIKRLSIEANTILSDDVLEGYNQCLKKEESPLGIEVINTIILNAEIAKKKGLATCQDTGVVVVFVDIGQDVHSVGGDMFEAITTGVRKAYKEGYFRKSTLDPIVRKNFGDNTPPVIHYEVVKGDKLRLAVLPKGFGSENMARATMFHPAVGLKGIKKHVVDLVSELGANACPPLIVGVGIGGTMEKAAVIAKKSMIRPIGKRHSRPDVAKLEEELIEEINKLGIGPMGFGGRMTAMDVHIEVYPTHIASYPVAVNIQCHAYRHKEEII
jgi:fumarate hydratase subunit alpha